LDRAALRAIIADRLEKETGPSKEQERREKEVNHE